MTDHPGTGFDPAELEQEHDDDLPGLSIEQPPGDAQVAEPSGEESELGPLAKSSAVGFWGISCPAGAWSSFRVQHQAFPYTARFVFVDAIGGRRYSGFATHNASEYPPAVIWARYPYALPRGTKQVWGYWWEGMPSDHAQGSPYWNSFNTNC